MDIDTIEQCCAGQSPHTAELIRLVNTLKCGTRAWRRAVAELEAVNLESAREQMRGLPRKGGNA